MAIRHIARSCHSDLALELTLYQDSSLYRLQSFLPLAISAQAGIHRIGMI